MNILQPYSLLVCRSCAVNLRHLARRPLRGVRSGSSLAGTNPSAFTSFFFHNDRWVSPRRSHSNDANTEPAATDALAAQLPLSSASGVVLKRSEVLTPRRLMRVYMQLSKSHLTMLVVLTAMSGVALSPLPTSVPVLLATAIGTTLCSASANTLNQLQEIPFDAQMARTRMRPLVRRAITPMHASAFAAVTGIAGPAILWTMVNPITAILGTANIALYAGAYTWMKRKTIANTWVGSVVGGLPPLMGWTACGGQLLPSASNPVQLFLPSFLTTTPVGPLLIDNPLAPFALFMILFSWQFPHFNALSHKVRDSYSQAGYRMLCVVDPRKNTVVSLRHTILLIGICSILVPLSGLTTWTFSFVSLVPNAVLTDAAWKFWRSGSERDAMKLFQHSLWWLPVMLGLMMLCKRGLDWRSWVGLSADEDKQE